MLTVGPTLSCEDGIFERDIQSFAGGPEQRVAQHYSRLRQEQRLIAELNFSKFVGPEERKYEDLIFGAMALYLVNRGIDDRRQQAERDREIANNKVSVAIENNFVWLKLVSTEYLTIQSAQNRGTRLVEAEFQNGVVDPVYEALMNSEKTATEFIESFDREGAKIYEFRTRTPSISLAEVTAIAGC